MRRSIVVIMCICFLTSVLSGCGTQKGNVTEHNDLTEKNKTAAMEDGGQLNAADTAELGNVQPRMTEESGGKIVSSGEESDWQHWQQAYLAKAEEIETEYGFSMEYDLIYLDGDDIPELVAGPTGYWFILYTWKDGETYELMHEGYGTHGRIYCYEPYQGIIEESVYDMITEEKESDSYTIFYTTYHTITENLKITEQYELIEECRETGSTYFYQDVPWTEPWEIEVEEFSSYKKENLPEIYGRFDLEVLRCLLENADDSSAHSTDYGNMAGQAVKSLLVTETYYDGEGAVTSQSQIKYEYDLVGNQIRIILGHEEGAYYEYKYDDSGNLSEEVSYEDGVITSHVKYEYNEDGRKIKSLACFGESSKMVSVYQYNYFGNMTMEATYSYYGEIVNKTCYLYEYGRGNLIRRNFFKEDILESVEEYEYDNFGNLIKEVSYDAEGNIFWLCEYDHSGNLVKEESYDEEGNALWFNGYDYDENGNVIEEMTLSYIKKYEYDGHNNKTKEIYYLIDGSIAHYVEWTYEWLQEIIPIEKDIKPEQSAAADSSSESIVSNPYFYDQNEVLLQAKAKYFDGRFQGSRAEKAAYIDVEMLQTYENGGVYKFTVEIDEDDVYFAEDWLNYYFYVTEDKIYEVPSSINVPSEGLVFHFNEDISSLPEMFDKDEKLVEWSTIVCQEDEMLEDQESYYQRIAKTGNQITYYSNSLKANGDVYRSLYYTWEEGKGLISCGFRDGVGEGYDFTLYDIEELTVAGE